jgi:predicted HAD superfamily Cof-like phosphohydrolase
MQIYNENGIYLPAQNRTEFLKEKRDWAEKEFKKLHKCCPRCKIEWYGEQTCMGCIYPSNHDIYSYYYDDNYITCYKCGFRGTMTNLIPEQNMDPNIEMNFDEEYSFSEHFENNKQIMNTVGQVTSDTIRVPSAAERILRANLIYEEAMETIEALGVDFIFGQLIDAGEEHYDPKAVLDGACDIAVVTNGTLLCCGLHTKFAEALKRVDENNLTKVGPGFTLREDGKYQKPPNYVPVVLDDLIEEMR